MVTVSDLIKALAPEVRADAIKAGLAEGEADDYARTVVTFL
jgi:adenine-specific DNA methylase